MSRLSVAESFAERASYLNTLESLSELLVEFCHQTNLDYFALVHHVDFGREATAGIRLHNYPEIWKAEFDDRGLGRSDPVHKASHKSTIGFPWSRIPFMIKLTAADRDTFADANRLGIGDGFTVPAHAPGELNGS